MKTLIAERKVKVCPVVTQDSDSGNQLLLFRHPLAGIQLVKGTLEVDDSSVRAAALRKLAEEAGISQVE